eukprot:GEMP01046537.1.p1 GENE.GEMP01046537.1~~GEMP01046537.1.p1  ORF type:complete len:469 (+),score=79.46 GEMP01046537.1:90-1496(+)
MKRVVNPETRAVLARLHYLYDKKYANGATSTSKALPEQTEDEVDSHHLHYRVRSDDEISNSSELRCEERDVDDPVRSSKSRRAKHYVDDTVGLSESPSEKHHIDDTTGSSERVEKHHAKDRQDPPTRRKRSMSAVVRSLSPHRQKSACRISQLRTGNVALDNACSSTAELSRGPWVSVPDCVETEPIFHTNLCSLEKPETSSPNTLLPAPRIFNTQEIGPFREVAALGSTRSRSPGREAGRRYGFHSLSQSSTKVTFSGNDGGVGKRPRSSAKKTCRRSHSRSKFSNTRKVSHLAEETSRKGSTCSRSPVKQSAQRSCSPASQLSARRYGHQSLSLSATAIVQENERTATLLPPQKEGDQRQYGPSLQFSPSKAHEEAAKEREGTAEVVINGDSIFPASWAEKFTDAVTSSGAYMNYWGLTNTAKVLLRGLRKEEQKYITETAGLDFTIPNPSDVIIYAIHNLRTEPV